MNYVGISNGFHDAGISVVGPNGDILFAGHSERYSKHKHDKDLCLSLAQDAKSHVQGESEIHYYERPLVTALRQLRAAQPIDFKTAKSRIGKEILKEFNNPKVVTHEHHLSHAAAGFQTSPYDEATVVIIDAIGEFDCISIWNAWYDNKGYAQYKKLWSKKYPHSIGLYYSAMTQHVGLKPLDEEYILMGMAAYGQPIYFNKIEGQLLESSTNLEFKENLHIGVPEGFLEGANEMDVAASAQALVEYLINTVMGKARMLGKSRNLVYGGGVALNCLANRNLGDYFSDMWIVPNPGDCGSSLGAAALGYGKKLNWIDAFLGHNIPGNYPSNRIIDELVKTKIVGVASGRAEFGPRALGNRSLLADPRGDTIKDTVNEIKRRQKFRPFAPIILEEYVHDYFDMPRNWRDSRYMQVIATCRHPDLFPAIVHADGTSRVQTVPKDGSGVRELLEKWFVMTGCPILLNTSLNIRGEPMVNDRSDADRFETLYNVKVIS